MFKHRTVIWLLIIYLLLQLSSLYQRIGVFVFIYPVIYLIAIIYAAIIISRTMMHSSSLRPFFNLVALFFITNLILFLIYLPTIVYNPEINWRLKGEQEQDPMILTAYIPIAFFIISFVALGLTAIFSRIAHSLRTRE